MEDEPRKPREMKRAYLESPAQDAARESSVSEEDAPPPVVQDPNGPRLDLNIKVIAKSNLHIEPKNFNQELEVKMKKYHRKVFYNEDGSTDEELNEPSQSTTGNEADNIETGKKPFDDNISIASSNGQQINNEGRVTQDEGDASENSTEYLADYQQLTSEDEVYREATDRDEAESTVNGKNEKDELDAEQMDLEGDTKGDGENKNSVRESQYPKVPISGNDASDESKKIDKVKDNKAATTQDSHIKSGLSDDEYETYEIETVSNSDVAVGNTSADNAATGGDSNKNSKGSEDKSTSLDKNADKIERKYFVPDKSSPISETGITQSIPEETGTLDELNMARMSWPSSSKGTKRVAQEILEEELPHEYKRHKLVDVGVQTTEDGLDMNELNNRIFVGIPNSYKLCGCRNHICD